MSDGLHEVRCAAVICPKCNTLLGYDEARTMRTGALVVTRRITYVCGTCGRYGSWSPVPRSEIRR